MINFKFPAEMLSQHLAIVGRTGSGKTYTAKGFVEGLLAAKRRVCILDPTGVWYGLRSTADGKRAGFPVAVFGGSHADVPIGEQSGAALAKILASKNLPAIIDLSEMLIGQRHRFVTGFAEALYRENRAPLHLVIDEADEFAPQNPLPETKRMLHQIDRIVRRGRTRGFRVALITQRPAVLHKNVLTQANTLIAMRLTAPQDRKAMQAWVEGQADVAQAKAVLDSLARLAQGEGWVWAPELDFLERVRFPKITTFDSSRTPGDDEVVSEPTKLAAVDLREIKDSFEAVEQEARTIQELRAEVAKLKAAPATKPAAAAPKPGAVPDVTVTALRQELAEAIRRRDALELVLNGWHDRARRIAATLLESVGDIALGTKKPERLVAAVARNEVRKTVAAPAGVSGLRAGAVRILQELAARSPAGYSRPQVGTLTQFAHKGGTFTTYIGDLRRGGFIEERSGLMYATEAGIHALGDKVPAKPTSHAEAMALWRKALRAGAYAILEAIVEAGASGITRQEVADAVSMTAAGGTFTTYLGDLRRNGLITDRDKRCTANDILFPEQRP